VGDLLNYNYATIMKQESQREPLLNMQTVFKIIGAIVFLFGIFTTIEKGVSSGLEKTNKRVEEINMFMLINQETNKGEHKSINKDISQINETLKEMKSAVSFESPSYRPQTTR
jgi:hypothetical protein